MVTITARKERLIELLGRKISDEELQEELPQIKCGVDGFAENGEMILEVTGDRPDLLSIEGVARALKGRMGIEKGIVETDFKNSGMKMLVDKSVKEAREFVVCAIARNVYIDDERIKEMMQVQEKLHITHGRRRRKVAIGIHNLDVLKPPFYYKTVAADAISFVPLGKTEKMDLREILEKHEKGKDYAFIFENAGKHQNAKYPVIVDSEGNVVSFPPIINGILTEVNTETKNLLIEITGTDFNACNTALNILCNDFRDSGATIETVEIEGEKGKRITPETEPEKMELKISEANRILGTEMSAKEIIECLAKQRITAKEGAKGKIECELPRYRADFLHPIDIIEEVALGYGYNKFEIKEPTVFTKGEMSGKTKTKEKVADLMAGAGFVELSTYFLGAGERRKNALGNENVIRIRNPMSSDYDSVRAALLPNLLEVLSKNTHEAYPQKIFEIGEVAIRDGKNECNVSAPLHLCGISAHSQSSLSEIASILSEAVKKLGRKMTLEKSESAEFIKGRQAKIIMDGKVVGKIGELHPQVLENFGLEVPASAFEIMVD